MGGKAYAAGVHVSVYGSRNFCMFFRYMNMFIFGIAVGNLAFAITPYKCVLCNDP